MMVREIKRLITSVELPPGWTAYFSELRGYDSPDRWWSAEGPFKQRVQAGTPEALVRKVQESIEQTRPTSIFLDVDEVLANWLDATFAVLRVDRQRIHEKWASYAPRPWDVCEVLGLSATFMWEKIHAEGAAFWESLELYPWAHELVDLCQSYAPTTLLTSPSRNPCSYAGKAAWLHAHFPDVPHFIGNGKSGGNKERCAHPRALLIDDSPKNCAKFEAAKGVAVLFPGLGNELFEQREDPLPYVREQLALHFGS